MASTQPRAPSATWSSCPGGECGNGLSPRCRLTRTVAGNSLELTQMIVVGGGSPAQPLHSDGGYCLMEYHDICEHKISTIWACNDDFSEELGAT